MIIGAVDFRPRRADQVKPLESRLNLEGLRLPCALVLSLLFHGWLLSLTFGKGGWLPGFSLPWEERRIELSELRVALVPASPSTHEPAVTPAADALPQANGEQSIAKGPPLTPYVSPAPPREPFAAAIMPEATKTDAKPSTETNPNTDAKPTPAAKPRTSAKPTTVTKPKPTAKPKTIVKPRTDTATGTAPANVPSDSDRPGDAAPPPAPPQDVIAVQESEEPTWTVPETQATPPPVTAEAPSVSSPPTEAPSVSDTGDAARARIDQEASKGAVEPAKLDSSKREGQRQEEQEAARQDVARQEEAQREKAQAEKAQAEKAQSESARLEAERQEAARAEAARVEAARVEAARVEAARVEAARVEAARVEAARVEAARVEAARVEAQEADAKREAIRRAIGRQLDEEAARRDAQAAAERSLPSWRTARRYRLFGRTDPNAEIILYAEAWARKIELNMTIDTVREAAKQPHSDPLVTVAIRSDGSVESVTIVQSSGVAAIDEAIRRIVDSQKPYRAFPPALASEYDVIEIRRTWYFDMAVRLY